MLITRLPSGQLRAWDFERPDSPIGSAPFPVLFDEENRSDSRPGVDPVLANVGVWSVSPDGSRVAVSTRTRYGEHQLLLLSVSGQGAPLLLNEKWNEPSFDRAPSLQFSPDSRWFLELAEHGHATLWDLATTKPAAVPIELLGHQYSTTCAAFSADSKWLATGGRDSTIRLWDLSDTSQLAQPVVLTGHTQGISAWQTRCEDLVKLALQTAGRDLTPTERQQFSLSTP
jgi:WD40 repeat protein